MKNLPCKDKSCQIIMDGMRDYSLREYCFDCEIKHGSRFQSLAAKAHEAVIEALDEQGKEGA